ncbi:hypothetical protein AC579_7517 [Pseudocercospora musae]|uniref:Uncharacterized protein n=1 Tax=Pseudocercospora musae TaxID=113226 RepID=A0A139I775_9PEZI|nr:hypothetical protein AC579_7517 [Pseudocercospora musae]KXT10594.1 hypothetical protein AC579_7517 [Pseudocercospora musae]
MTNLQNAISCQDRLNHLELDYLNSLVTARISQPSDVSLQLRLPRELRDCIYYFAAAEILKEWPSKTMEESRYRALLSDCRQASQKFHRFKMVTWTITWTIQSLQPGHRFHQRQ